MGICCSLIEQHVRLIDRNKSDWYWISIHVMSYILISDKIPISNDPTYWIMPLCKYFHQVIRSPRIPIHFQPALISILFEWNQQVKECKHSRIKLHWILDRLKKNKLINQRPGQHCCRCVKSSNEFTSTTIQISNLSGSRNKTISAIMQRRFTR